MGHSFHDRDMLVVKEWHAMLDLERELGKEFEVLETFPSHIGAFNGFFAAGGHVLGLVLHDKLKSFPEAMCCFQSLKELDLSFNQLSSVPESIGELKSLTRLHLMENQLTSLPESIGELKSLQVLWVYENQLSSVPESIGELKPLEMLYLSKNQLTSLPDSIGELKSLVYLDVGGNQLTSLPETFGGLASLENLSLSMNKLSALPKSMKQLTSLKIIAIGNNQFSSLVRRRRLVVNSRGSGPPIQGARGNHADLHPKGAGSEACVATYRNLPVPRQARANQERPMGNESEPVLEASRTAGCETGTDYAAGPNRQRRRGHVLRDHVSIWTNDARGRAGP